MDDGVTMLNTRWTRDALQAVPSVDAMDFDAARFERAGSVLDDAAACRPGRAAMAWLRSLPVELQPVQLMRGHARIANLLCHRWDDPELALRYLRELLIDGRGGRHGFAAPVAGELRALAEHLVWQLRGRHH
jgi:hypothetical protein